MDAEVRKATKIINKLGLHARAAAKLVNLASRFKAKVSICRDNHEANAKSIMSVMMLAAPKGASVEVVAQGEDAVDAVDALERLIAERFNEPE